MIHIVFCTDENYAFNFPVIAQSVLEHHAKEEVAFHLLHSALSATTAEKVDRYVEETGIQCSKVLLDDAIFHDLPRIAYYGIAIYYRLLIPELFPQELDKVLYLDMDVLVEGRLDELWNQDLSGKAAAVVEDGLPKHMGKHATKSYFNSGVMLINLDYWREHKVKEQAINFMVKHPEILRYPDQDALNVVLEHDLVYVPGKWNYHLNLDKRFLRKALKGRLDGEHAPVIVHFNQKLKPWMYHCKHPYTARYWQLLKKTTFKDYKMKNRSFVNFLFYSTPKLLRAVLWPRRAAILPQN